MSSKILNIGYDLRCWKERGEKVRINADIMFPKNSHCIIASSSGGGKSYALKRIMGGLVKAEPDGEIMLADFKSDDTFSEFRSCNNYFPYTKVYDAIDIMYEKMQRRISLEETDRTPCTLVIDEYVSAMATLADTDKKEATRRMSQISSLLMLSRSLSMRIILVSQRMDAQFLPLGSRMNAAYLLVLGSTQANTANYEMLMSEYLSDIKNMEFGIGEGVLLDNNNSKLYMVKIPKVRDEKALNELCKKALS